MQNIHENPSIFSCLWSALNGSRAVFYLGDESFRYGQSFRNVHINHIGTEFVNQIQKYFVSLDELKEIKERFLIGA
ncbi:hypothetical protein [Enterobacter asburiae]|uniref:hypothetical protein n=1 Tax=Enterobacter asburiae TaxID=61645 RepID=UPI001BDFB968|nr:hypothetical protein [Enterobacter asburiae]MBT2048478.1 hypothetical protein [Enterobacter asburiae]